MKIINTYSGILTTYTLESANNFGEQRLTIRDNKTVQRVLSRRVTNNEESTIQFVIETYNSKTNRTKVTSFAVPAIMCEQFLAHLEAAK